jgi:hypothetical protein
MEAFSTANARDDLAPHLCTHRSYFGDFGCAMLTNVQVGLRTGPTAFTVRVTPHSSSLFGVCQWQCKPRIILWQVPILLKWQVAG